jgi:hypothetical protein
MTDFNPLTVPAIMPKQVRRVLENGTPTQAQLDYEQALQAWTRDNVANTNIRLNEVSSEIDGVSSSVTTVEDALSTLEGAVASASTEVKARFGEASGQGGLNITAAATGGANAESRVSLNARATNASTSYAVGMEMVVDTVGNRRIEFDASRVSFITSGTGARIEIRPDQGIYVYGASGELLIELGEFL